MVTRVIGSGRMREGGKLVTYRQDHEAHITGGDFRHAADHIDVTFFLSGFYRPNIQQTIEVLSNYTEALVAVPAPSVPSTLVSVDGVNLTWNPSLSIDAVGDVTMVSRCYMAQLILNTAPIASPTTVRLCDSFTTGFYSAFAATDVSLFNGSVDGFEIGGVLGGAQPSAIIIDSADTRVATLLSVDGTLDVVGSFVADGYFIMPEVSIQWDSATVAPFIYQDDYTGAFGVGNDLTVKAQTCTGPLGQGGALVLEAGSGDLNGAVYLRDGYGINMASVSDAGFVTYDAIYRHFRVISAAGNYSVLPSDHIIYIDTALGVISLRLPDSAPGDQEGREIIVIDLGNATANNVTIYPFRVLGVGDTIIGGVSDVLLTNYEQRTYRLYGADWSAG